MPSAEETVREVLAAPSLDERVARIRRISHDHGTGEHAAIYASIARQGYVPYLAPDFAYIHAAPFYERDYFEEVYDVASTETTEFTEVSAEHLRDVLTKDPRTLLVFRTILGLTRDEFSHSTKLVAKRLGVSALSSSKIDSMERSGTAVKPAQANVAAETVVRVMEGSLFGDPPGDLKSKQDKPDTEEGWHTVHELADHGVPYSMLLHQRHYGGAFRQVLDATSTQRGDLIEDAVEALFIEAGVPYIRTGSHNQGDIEARFGLRVTPAPDFVVYDQSGALRAILECKGASDGGTARDKALRFERLHAESVRLNGVPLIAVLGGMGWSRVNDTLGPIVRDTDGRVFTVANLPTMLEVAPFPQLINTASDGRRK